MLERLLLVLTPASRPPPPLEALPASRRAALTASSAPSPASYEGTELPETARDPILPSAEWSLLAEEFPTISVETGPAVIDPFEADATASLDASSWKGQDRKTLYALDAQLETLTARGPTTLRLVGPDLTDLAGEVLTRFQRFASRRNPASASTCFDQALTIHRALHDLQKPLVRADFAHALDVWQWLLRLDPEASLAAQLAALFHDIERLTSEADARVEHRAPDYQRFKDLHAHRGATVAASVLASAGLDASTLARVEHLIRRHERPQSDPELALLNDADGLSFFSLNSGGFLDYFGPDHTRRKVAYTLNRLRREARARLFQIRCSAELTAMIAAELSSPAPAPRYEAR